MKHRTSLVAAAVFAGLTMASNAMAAPSKNTQDFVHNVSVANEFEIESSKLALTKSDNAEVKQFAQQMINDHGKAGADFKSTLPKSSAAAMPVSDKLDAKHQAILDKLNGEEAGDNFDRDYIEAQTDAHKEAVSLFKSYSRKGDDKALQSFASRTLPTLEQHDKHVKKLKMS